MVWRPHENTQAALADSFGLRGGARQEFFDLAALARRELPRDLASDEELLAKLPVDVFSLAELELRLHGRAPKRRENRKKISDGPHPQAFELLGGWFMTIELVSHTTGQVSRLSSKAFGKLLHLARLNGWWPEKAAEDWPEQNWDTQVILPYIGPYMPGSISRPDAEGLMRALVKAKATGQTAVDGSIQFASGVLLQVARAGGFHVRFNAMALAGAAH